MCIETTAIHTKGGDYSLERNDSLIERSDLERSGLERSDRIPSKSMLRINEWMVHSTTNGSHKKTWLSSCVTAYITCLARLYKVNLLLLSRSKLLLTQYVHTLMRKITFPLLSILNKIPAALRSGPPSWIQTWSQVSTRSDLRAPLSAVT